MLEEQSKKARRGDKGPGLGGDRGKGKGRGRGEGRERGEGGGERGRGEGGGVRRDRKEGQVNPYHIDEPTLFDMCIRQDDDVYCHLTLISS